MSLQGSDAMALVWAQLWQVTALVVVVALLTRLAAANRPQLAFVLWLVVLVKCVTPPLWSSPSGVFCWLSASEAAAAPKSVPLLPLSLPSADGPENLPVSFSVSGPTRSGPRTASVADERQTSASVPLPDLATLLAGTWAAGVLLMSFVMLWRWRWIARLIRRLQDDSSSEYEDLLRQVSTQLGRRRPVRLAITEGPLGPAVFGLLRPVILLPKAVVEKKTTEELAPILAHELIHLRRRDHWWGLLRAVVASLWWFHPLVRWAAHKASLEAERCCDEAVLAELQCPAPRYARCLLEILEIKQQSRLMSACPGMRGVEVTQGRLERIMKIRSAGYKRMPWWCWMAAGLVAVVTLPGAAICLSSETESTVAVDDAWGYGAGKFLPSSSPAATSRSASPVEPRSTKTYAVGDVLTKIQEAQGLTEPECREVLKDFLRSAVQLPQVTAPAQSNVDIVSSDTELLIEATDSQHEQIAQAVETFRKYGASQIVIQAIFFSKPGAEAQLPGIDWILLAPKFTLPTAEALSIEAPSAREETSPHSLGCSMQTRTDRPVLYQILDDTRYEQVRARLTSDRGTKILQAPKITVFNGQSASVWDTSQSSFVVGVKEITGEYATAHVPVVRVVSEGTTLHLQPLVQAPDKMRLGLGLTVSKLGKVSTVTGPTTPGQQPVTVQVPEVHTTCLNANVEVPLKHWLLLGSLTCEDAQGKPESRFVLLRAEKVERPKLAAVTQ